MEKHTGNHVKLIGSTMLVFAAGSFAYWLYQAGRNFAGPLKQLGISAITRKYDPQQRGGEIVFYGASNFTRWAAMEKDIPQYKVQNHGFGGSTDQDLIDYAPVLLYPYQPKIVVFQTGSNDYVSAPGTAEEKLEFCMRRKQEMFEQFHRHLPNAHFVVMSGLLLPGRSEFRELTQKLNRQLEEFCSQRDYMTYVNAEELTYRNNEFDRSRFVKDMIHLTPEAQKTWAVQYIIPALDRIQSSHKCAEP